jgi:hypothetical protein
MTKNTIRTVLYGVLAILVIAFVVFTALRMNPKVETPLSPQQDTVKKIDVSTTTVDSPEMLPNSVVEEKSEPTVNIINPAAVVSEPEPKPTIANTPVMGVPVKMIPPKPLTPEQQQALLDEMRKASN